jgi:hypothetical protein
MNFTVGEAMGDRVISFPVAAGHGSAVSLWVFPENLTKVLSKYTQQNDEC